MAVDNVGQSEAYRSYTTAGIPGHNHFDRTRYKRAKAISSREGREVRPFTHTQAVCLGDSFGVGLLDALDLRHGQTQAAAV
jgi:hypothetical protein